MTYGITGAGGQLGSSALRHLLTRVPTSNVVAVTRTPDRLKEFADRGVRVRAGDFKNAAELTGALEGVDRLLLIPMPDLMPGVRPPLHRAGIEAARKAGVRHVVYVSSVGARPAFSDDILNTHFETEQALIGSGLAWTLLRMGPYADFLIDPMKAALTNGAHASRGEAPAAPVVRDDLGAAAAGLLASDGHAGLTYHATGPVSLTGAEIAAGVGAAFGKDIAFTALSDEQVRSGLAAAGLPAPMADVLARFQDASAAGLFDVVTHDVERLSGRPAQSPVSFIVAALKAQGVSV
jgi:NAD(P)H dehydrogenase (quinone)